MIALIVFATICTLAYLFLLWHYHTHWNPLPVTALSAPTGVPFISVVIAARNEEKTIGLCLASVLNQSYPDGRFEIVLVNDHSEDKTEEIASSFSSVRVISATDAGTGKKHALKMGIANCRGDIVAMTDADCIVQPGWLQSIADAFSAKTELITGPVLLRDQPTLFDSFQGIDLLSLAMITASGIESRLHHLANGANMAVRKAAYDRVAGHQQDEQYASGDDIFLVQRIAKAHAESVRYNWSPESIVYTEPSMSLRTFAAQRVRWGTKNKNLLEKSVFRIWAFIWITYALILVAIVTSAFISFQCLLISAILLVTVAIGEYLFLRRGAYYYQSTNLLRKFIPCFLMHYVYVLAIGIASVLITQYSWKGRRVR